MPARFCYTLFAFILLFTFPALARRIKFDGPLQDSLVQNITKKILDLKIKGLTVTDVRFLQQGTYAPEASPKALTELPAFCLIAVSLCPVPGSLIKIELWLPQNGWNGRFLGRGNGGLAGRIAYNPLAGGLKQGYATANTDMGTSRGADSAIGNPETWILVTGPPMK